MFQLGTRRTRLHSHLPHRHLPLHHYFSNRFLFLAPLPSPGVAQHPKISGNDLASVNTPRGGILPLCVSHFISIPPSDFQDPGPSWLWAALPALQGERADDLTPPHILWQMPGRGPQQPRSLHRYKGPYCPCTISSLSVFSMSSTIGLQTSYKLGFCWLFTLFLRRSARCSSCAQGELVLSLIHI